MFSNFSFSIYDFQYWCLVRYPLRFTSSSQSLKAYLFYLPIYTHILTNEYSVKYSFRFNSSSNSFPFFKWSSFEIFWAILWLRALTFFGFYLNIFYKIWFNGIFLLPSSVPVGKFSASQVELR